MSAALWVHETRRMKGLKRERYLLFDIYNDQMKDPLFVLHSLLINQGKLFSNLFKIASEERTHYARTYDYYGTLAT